MAVALLFSRRGSCERMQTGAVITKSNRIISTGYNGPPAFSRDCLKACRTDQPCQRAIHAEANAIYFAALNGISLKDATIYCTHSPCAKCAEAIIQAGISQVYFAEEYRDITGLEVLKQSGIPYNKI